MIEPRGTAPTLLPLAVFAAACLFGCGDDGTSPADVGDRPADMAADADADVTPPPE